MESIGDDSYIEHEGMRIATVETIAQHKISAAITGDSPVRRLGISLTSLS
ncbi:hypothetical protein HML84_01005 [Alcanivorax sp. IO_7]|nr:hypothetical protein HML84_01005 [Alcanivorax sp. IO_7]